MARRALLRRLSTCAVAAVARRADLYLGAGKCLGEQRLDVRSLDDLAARAEALVEAVE